MLMRALLVLICALAAISSSTAEALGLENERILVFSGLVAVFCAVPFLRGAALPHPGAGLLCLCLMLLGILVQDALTGRVDPIDYKVVLLLGILITAPAIVDELGEAAVLRFAWWLLALYISAAFAYQLMAEPAIVERGYSGIVRYDVTGSVIMHASLSLIALLLALTRAAEADRMRGRLLSLAVASMALMMVLETATRTVIITLALFACFRVATADDRRAAFSQLLGAAAGLILVFALYTAFWNPSFLLRLTSTEVTDYGSGRLPSLAFWLGQMGDHPFGLGFGAVRELMAGGKPDLDGESTLEWPHNEFARFYLEAGPLGLAFVLLLIGYLVRLALQAAACDPLPLRRTLMLAIAADLVAESSLQNLLNAIHHASVLIIFLALAAESVRHAPDPDRADIAAGQATLTASS